MTSFMDILTVLLLFLLKSFVVDADVSAPAPGVELPNSTSEDRPSPSVVIAVSPEAVLVAGEPVTTIESVLARDEVWLEEIAVHLDDARRRTEEIAAARGREPAEGGKVTIQGDREIEFQLLQRVMYTCNFTGFERLSLAVVQEG